MTNFITRAVKAIWTAIKDATKWVGRSIAGAFKWVWEQFANLYQWFTGRVDDAVDLACEARGIPKEKKPPKMDEMINKSMRDTAEFMNKQLDNIVDFIMQFDLCGDDEGVDMHDILFDDLENRGEAPQLLIHPQESNAL